MENDDAEELSSREPTVEDLVGLCKALNDQGAMYMVIGGFAMRAIGYDRRTMDVDLLIDTSPEMLWRMKAKTHREKDAADLMFLRHLLGN